MAHRITADHLAEATPEAVIEELFRELNKALQPFYNEECDQITVFRILCCTRI